MCLVPCARELDDYNAKIKSICTNKQADICPYEREYFKRSNYVFGDGEWLVIVGEDKKIVTAFPPNDYDD
ncbi:MAG: hypothetical protein QME63_08540, partial [Actinomycetota bacterium]|nr:hypothetical protein [Actinomycetota bacterium]